jgi:hypothetical protein
VTVRTVLRKCSTYCPSGTSGEPTSDSGGGDTRSTVYTKLPITNSLLGGWEAQKRGKKNDTDDVLSSAELMMLSFTCSSSVDLQSSSSSFRGVPWDAVAAHPGTSPAKEGTSMSRALRRFPRFACEGRALGAEVSVAAGPRLGLSRYAPPVSGPPYTSLVTPVIRPPPLCG